jgi:hypothetical protein
MAGNKALEKFKQSKIPKKGKAKVTIEIPIHKEPNTHSQIIGRIKKDQEITWISKSICDEREWIRCNNVNDYGYIVGYEKDGKCNLDIGTIKENKEEDKKEVNFDSKVEIIPLTKEEIKYGEDALNEILNDEEEEADDEKKDDKSNDSKTNISTENDESQKSEISKLEEEELDNWFGDDISKIDLIKLIKYENDKLENEIRCQSKKEKDKNKKNKKIENDNSVIKAIKSLKEGLSKDAEGKINDYTINLTDNLEEIHEASVKKTQEEEEQAKKDENDKKKKKDKKEKKDKKGKKDEIREDQVEVNGVIFPRDYSKTIGDLSQTLEYCKEYFGIPKDQKPLYWTYNYDRSGKWQPGKVIIFQDPNDEDEVINFRIDEIGHKFEGKYYLPPHVNGPEPEGLHFYYNGEGDIDVNNIPFKSLDQIKKEEEERKKRKEAKNKKNN